MPAPITTKTDLVDAIVANDYNSVKEYIEDGTYRINTLALEIGDTSVITDSRVLQNVTNTNWDAAYSHSVITTGNPHQLDADDIDDTSTTNKFVTSGDIIKLSNLSGTNTGDQDLSGKQDNITLTTTGTSGAATLVGATLNIPQYTAGGGGDVVKVGTPADNQIAVWTGDGTIEGTSSLTYNSSNKYLTYTANADDNSLLINPSDTGGTVNSPYWSMRSYYNNTPADMNFRVVRNDSATYYFEISDSAGDPVFTIDESGNLEITGDLNVTTGGDALVLNQTGGVNNNFFSFQSSGVEIAYMDGGRIGIMKGTEAAPGYTFFSSPSGYWTTTGFWSPSSGIVAVSSLGNEVSRFTSTGFDVTGNITVSGTVDGIDIATDVAANTLKVGVTDQISNVVEDTTPQLGGNLSWNAKGMILESISPSGLSAGNIARFNGTNWVQADASAESTANGMLGIYVSTNTILTHGVYTTSGLTAGATYYLSETAGAITTTAPSTSTSIVRIVGYALSTTQLFVDPDKSYVEVA